MMKHIFYILLSALLILGMGETSQKHLQGFRDRGGIPVNVASSSSKSCDCAFTMAAEHSGVGVHPQQAHKNADYKGNDAILAIYSIPVNSTPFKILKFDPVLSVVQTLKLLNSQISEHKGSLLSDTDYIKYSNRYYVYTLSRILI